MPPPLPHWKKQLNLKLDTYRSRQQAREDAESTEDTEPTQPLDAPKKKAKAQPAPIVEPRPMWRNKVIAFQSPEGTDDGPETEIGQGETLPSPTPHWRKIEATSSPKLPPLVRNGENSTTVAKDLVVDKHPTPPSAPKPAQHTKAQNRTAPVRERLISGVLDMAVVLVALGVFIGVVRGIGGDIIGTGAESLRTICSVFLGLLFFYWTFYLRYIGETAGMNWMRLRVVTFDGKAPSTVQKWIRTAGTILSFCAAGVGFFWALADEEKLTWHDRMSRTYVTDEPDQVAASQPTVRLERPRERPLPRAARRA